MRLYHRSKPLPTRHSHPIIHLKLVLLYTGLFFSDFFFLLFLSFDVSVSYCLISVFFFSCSFA